MTLDEAEKIKTVVENKNYTEQLVNTVAKENVEKMVMNKLSMIFQKILKI